MIKINSSPFNAAVRKLAKLSGEKIERVVEYEAGKVLESALRFTPAMNIGKMTAKHESAGYAYEDIGNGPKFYNLRYRYSNKVWAQIQKKRALSLKRKRGARGLAKQSWQRLADEAGLSIKAPAYVRKAIATTGRAYPENAAARRQRRGGKFGISFSNLQPTINRRFGAVIIQRALSGRAKYFEKNLRKGVFTEMKQIERAYPGLKING